MLCLFAIASCDANITHALQLVNYILLFILFFLLFVFSQLLFVTSVPPLDAPSIGAPSLPFRPGFRPPSGYWVGARFHTIHYQLASPCLRVAACSSLHGTQSLNSVIRVAILVLRCCAPGLQLSEMWLLNSSSFWGLVDLQGLTRTWMHLSPLCRIAKCR